MPRSLQPAYPSLPSPSPTPAPHRPLTLKGELTRPYIYLPLLLSLLLFALALWDQSRYTLSLLSPILFLWSTVLLPLPLWAHLLWLTARAAWAYWDSYRELLRITIYESVALLLLLPVLGDVRRAVHAVLPLLPLRAARKGLELRIGWGYTLAQLARAAQWALGKAAGVSRVSGDAYRKALAPGEGDNDKQGFVAARLESIIRATASLSTSASISSTSPEEPPEPAEKRKPGRPRRLTANPFTLPTPAPFSTISTSAGAGQTQTHPPPSKITAAARKYRLPSPAESDRSLPASGSASALEHAHPEAQEGETPPRRYPRRTKMSGNMDVGGTPEPAAGELRGRGKELAGREKEREVKLELEVSPVKRGRGRPRKHV